jgi:glycogen operon protein
MLLAGDEAGRTQRGNNNAYCQDNEISWYDWEAAAEPNARELTGFVARLAALRRRFPMLRSPRFHHGARVANTEIEDIAWFDAAGVALTQEAWYDGEARVLVLRRADAAADHAVDVLAVLFNPTDENAEFALPLSATWTLLVDSADAEAPERAIEGDRIDVGAHAVAIAHARIEAASE